MTPPKRASTLLRLLHLLLDAVAVLILLLLLLRLLHLLLDAVAVLSLLLLLRLLHLLLHATVVSLLLLLLPLLLVLPVTLQEHPAYGPAPSPPLTVQEEQW
jgi:hypothetical protein